MLAVHWTPVSNTRHILKNGIAKSRRGVFCFPLTGHKSVDRWWVSFFNQCGVRPRKRCNGIVFRITEADMPAYFGHWTGATNNFRFDKEIPDLKSLGGEFRDIILWRLGEEIAWKLNHANSSAPRVPSVENDYQSLARQALGTDPALFARRMQSLDAMLYTFEDYQIVLSHAIPANRILKVLPQGNEFGRILRQRKIRGKRWSRDRNED